MPVSKYEPSTTNSWLRPPQILLVRNISFLLLKPSTIQGTEDTSKLELQHLSWREKKLTRFVVMHFSRKKSFLWSKKEDETKTFTFTNDAGRWWLYLQTRPADGSGSWQQLAAAGSSDSSVGFWMVGAAASYLFFWFLKRFFSAAAMQKNLGSATDR